MEQTRVVESGLAEVQSWFCPHRPGTVAVLSLLSVVQGPGSNTSEELVEVLV